MPPLVIIGAGQAAAQAVATLRGEGYDGGIVLYGDEPHRPYQRPPLSKAFLAGESEPGRLELRPAAFYDDLGVTLRLGVPVAAIDPAAGTVTTAAGITQPYAKLLITTGTRPRALPLPGDHLAGVHHIRAIRDVERFRAGFRPGARLVVIGGGYIGLEVAAKARMLGLDVTVVEGQPRILARVVAAETAAALAALHAAHGVILRTGTGVAGLTGTGSVSGVRLSNGSVLPADLVLIAVGAVPNVELAASAGIAVDNGILVDACTATSLPNIHAAGDVAAFPSRLYGRRIRLESVPNAIDQAKAAALALLGRPVRYDPVPWFWSDQYETKLQIAGLSQGFTEAQTTGEAGSGPFSVRYLRDGRLIAVDSLNDPRSHLQARRELAAGAERSAAA